MLAVLLGLAAVGDRLWADAAARTLARELQREAGLAAPPEVTIAGFPFVTQAVSGRFERIDVTARDVPAGVVQGRPVVVRRLSASVRGARVPLSDSVSGTVREVPVDRVDARVLLPYDAFSRSRSGARVTVQPAGERLRVSGTVRVLGRELEAAALSRLRLDDQALVVTAEDFDVGGGRADRLVTRALGDRFDLRIDLGGLPYGLRVGAVRVQPDGVVVTAVARDTVLSGRQGLP